MAVCDSILDLVNLQRCLVSATRSNGHLSRQAPAHRTRRKSDCHCAVGRLRALLDSIDLERFERVLIRCAQLDPHAAWTCADLGLVMSSIPAASFCVHAENRRADVELGGARAAAHVHAAGAHNDAVCCELGTEQRHGAPEWCGVGPRVEDSDAATAPQARTACLLALQFVGPLRVVVRSRPNTAKLVGKERRVVPAPKTLS